MIWRRQHVADSSSLEARGVYGEYRIRLCHFGAWELQVWRKGATAWALLATAANLELVKTIAETYETIQQPPT